MLKTMNDIKKMYGNEWKSIDIFELNSCLAPLVKMCISPFKKVRIIWGIFCAFMVAFLSGSIVTIITKYFDHVTVTRLEQIPTDEMIPPGITVCLQAHRVRSLENKSRSFNMSKHWKSLNKFETLHNRLDYCTFTSKWESRVHGKSPIYDLGGHYSIQFTTLPRATFSLNIKEQVFGAPDYICNTFEADTKCSAEDQFWKVLKMSISVEGQKLDANTAPLLIVHEPNSYPFDNHDKYIYLPSRPGSYNMFYSKVSMKRLYTSSYPCQEKGQELFGNVYSYDVASCKANQSCSRTENNGCNCPVNNFINLFKNISSSSTNSKGLSQSRKQSCNLTSPIYKCAAPCGWSKYTITTKMFNERNTNDIDYMIVQPEEMEDKNEEEIYNFVKLFSEIGGLSSFFFGFSVIVVFEIFEMMFKWRHKKRNLHFKQSINPEKFERSGYVAMLSLQGLRKTPTALRCVNYEANYVKNSPIFALKNVANCYFPDNQSMELSVNSEECSEAAIGNGSLPSRTIQIQVEFCGETFSVPCEIV